MTTTAGEKIGGWLLAPLAWLLMALLSASLALVLYSTALTSPHALKTLGAQNTSNIVMWFISFAFAIAMWYYTLWLTIAFFKTPSGCAETLYYLATGFCITGY
ncbi:Inner membrane protein ydgK [Leclercia adecarboxylata]|uniref:Inner membrane protein ydgK n=1 Tax=Leclercia adecarboxylata TaxID=83655 RepID=A0A4U9HSV9_9ENTR|nr:Inner membrane protein ydgK [Leclercia adecarboxylata]